MKLRNAVMGCALGIATLSYTPALLLAQEPWEAAPSQYQRDVERQGFHDGVEGARKDFQNHRQPNVENRDEYRHPKYGGPDKEAYRQSFRQGYEVGVQHIYHEGR